MPHPLPGRPWERRKTYPEAFVNGMDAELFDNVEQYSPVPNIRKSHCPVKFFLGGRAISQIYHFFNKVINF